MNFKHFVALNCLDVITTYIGLTYLGLTEQNTFANAIFNNMGLLEGLIGLKIVGLMVIWGVMKVYTPDIKKIAINISCFIFIVVVFNNLYHMINALM